MSPRIRFRHTTKHVILNIALGENKERASEGERERERERERMREKENAREREKESERERERERERKREGLKIDNKHVPIAWRKSKRKRSTDCIQRTKGHIIYHTNKNSRRDSIRTKPIHMLT